MCVHLQKPKHLFLGCITHCRLLNQSKMTLSPKLFFFLYELSWLNTNILIQKSLLQFLEFQLNIVSVCLKKSLKSKHHEACIENLITMSELGTTMPNSILFSRDKDILFKIQNALLPRLPPKKKQLTSDALGRSLSRSWDGILPPLSHTHLL